MLGRKGEEKLPWAVKRDRSNFHRNRRNVFGCHLAMGTVSESYSMSRYELFDRSRIELQSVSTRGHDLHSTDCLPLVAPSEPFEHPEFPDLVARIADARQHNRPLVLTMDAHVIKIALSRYIVDLIERRPVTHVAANSASSTTSSLRSSAEHERRGRTPHLSRWEPVSFFGAAA